MNVLSLFDGMSCGQIALNKAGVKYDNYFASEIDKYAIKITQKNYPKTTQLGSITDIKYKEGVLYVGDKSYNVGKIDLIIGGSPCTDLSIAGKMSGLKSDDLDSYLEMKREKVDFGGQSYLFWEYLRLMKEIKPKYFLLENVRMSKKWKAVITNNLGVEPIEIDSRYFSAQKRKRLYWTNIKGIEQPHDRGINLKDILEKEDGITNPSAIRGRYINKATIVGRRINDKGHREDYNKKIPITQCLEVRKTNINKSNCITTVSKDNVLTCLSPGRYIDVYGKNLPYRNYTLKELCRL